MEEVEPVSGPNLGPEDAASWGAMTNAHAYFDALVRRADCQAAYSLRDQGQIDRFKFGSYPVRVRYDATLDAAKWQWGINDLNAENIRVPISLIRPTSGSSKLLIISDHYWDAGWFTEWMETPNKRLDGWKWLQVTDNIHPGSTRQRVWFEPQMRWIGRDPGVLSYFGARGYTNPRPPTVKGGTSVILNGHNYLADTIGPMLNEFMAKPNTWTRIFIEIEQRAGDDYASVSMWMADESQNPVAILLNAEVQSAGLNTEFWLEYNTSREVRTGGPMVAAARNVVVLKDVADPRAVFAKPVR